MASGSDEATATSARPRRPGATGSGTARSRRSRWASPSAPTRGSSTRGEPVPPGTVGEIAVRRKGGWFPVKDRGWMDAEGYVHHEGRSDDVIISAGWTMSAVEIEDALLSHPDVREAAVVAAPDALRGQIPKAYVVAERADAAFTRELQEWVG